MNLFLVIGIHNGKMLINGQYGRSFSVMAGGGFHEGEFEVKREEQSYRSDVCVDPHYMDVQTVWCISMCTEAFHCIMLHYFGKIRKYVVFSQIFFLLSYQQGSYY